MKIEALLDGLRKQLEELEREFRQELPKQIQAARELGDLRESGEYETIKDRQGFVKARMAFLQQRISEISRIDLRSVPTDRVASGAPSSLKMRRLAKKPPTPWSFRRRWMASVAGYQSPRRSAEASSASRLGIGS